MVYPCIYTVESKKNQGLVEYIELGSSGNQQLVGNSDLWPRIQPIIRRSAGEGKCLVPWEC